MRTIAAREAFHRSAVGPVTRRVALTLRRRGDCGSDDEQQDSGDARSAVPRVKLPRLNGQKLQVAAVWTGTEQENFTKVLDEFEKRTGREGDLRARAATDHVNFLGIEDRGRQPAGRGDGAAGRRDRRQFAEKGWAKPLGADAKAQLAKNYSQGLAGPRRGRRHPVRRLLQGRQQVADLVQHQGLRERGRERAEDLGRTSSKTAETLSDSGVDRRSPSAARTAGRSPTGSRTSTSPRRARRSTTSSPSTRSSGRTPPSSKALTTLGELFGKHGLIAGGAERRAADGVPGLGHPDLHRRRPAQGRHGLRGATSWPSTSRRREAKIGTDAKVFPFPAVGADAPVVTGGDAAVALKDSKARAGAADLPGLARRGDRSGPRRAASSRRTRRWTSPPTRTTCSATSPRR